MSERALMAVAGDDTKASKCKSCGAAIRWAVTAKGKPQPLDFKPDPKGNTVIVAVTTVRDGHNVVEDRAQPFNPLLDVGLAVFMPHHATCKDAKAWKR